MQLAAVSSSAGREPDQHHRFFKARSSMKHKPNAAPMSAPDQHAPGARRAFLRRFAGFGAAAVGGALLAACGGGGDEASATGRESALNLGAGICDSLSARVADAAGNTIGYIDAYNDAVNLYVTVFTADNDNCPLRDMALWVGTNPANAPANVADFPWKKSVTGGVVTHQFVIALAGLGVNVTAASCASAPPTVHIAGQVTTACATGMISANTSYKLCCFSLPPVVLAGCETAFAKGSHVFTTDARANPDGLPSLGLSRNRWGWAINLTAPGMSSYPIFAGAGLNNTGVGTRVGTLTLSYTGSQVTATYAMAPGAKMTEAHLYAGDRKPATIAPGQFGNTATFSSPATTHSVTVPVSDSNGDGVWLIAHAVVC
jgi:hypothetical protein